MDERYSLPPLDGVLIGHADLTPWLDLWWQDEIALRRAGLHRAEEVYSDQWWSVAYSASLPPTSRVLRHPALGTLVRALLDDQPLPPHAARTAYTLAMSILVDSGELTAADVRGCTYLPGLSVAPGAAAPLPAITDTIEVNADEPMLSQFADPLDDLSETRAEWATVGADAWHVLATTHPAFAARVAALVRVVVPLRQRDGRRIGRPQYEIQSCSISSAPGVVFASLGRLDPWYTAEMLVHEAMHQLIEVIASLAPLTLDDAVLVPSPWKDEPRPPLALLHGIAAFGAAMRFWHRASCLTASPPHARSEACHRARQIQRAYITALSIADAYSPAALALSENLTDEAGRVLDGGAAPG